ncbi:hypothetical protein AVEN_53121-2-1, partial [Araneus ventricosus]
DCCKILNREGEFLRESGCEGEELDSAVCLRDHKGEGSRMRISAVKAAGDGKAAFVTWRYEGIGWKTDKLQVKLWTDLKDSPKVLTFSTLEHVFSVKDLEPGTMYSILLRPAPNIRTEELTYQFIIISFTEDGTFGALLTPIRMSVYVIWSGTLRVTWDEAQAFSESGEAKKSNKYSISHQMEAPDVKAVEIIIESSQEYHLTPISMKTEYTFSLGCFFVDKFHPCGVATIRTDPPNHIDRESSGLFTMYEVVNGSRLDWFEAEEDCRQREGHLTSLLTEEEGKTLLKVLPARDAKLWTGAKLKAVGNGTSYWTDGNKMTYLPMSKNSGVFASKDSCCRALNEAGRLRLSGGKCSDQLLYICKYLFRDPKSAVRFTLSPTGELSLETPMLVAMGMEGASVSATLYRGDEEESSATGDVKKIVLKNLIPEEDYELVVKDQGSDWEHRLSFNAGQESFIRMCSNISNLRDAAGPEKPKGLISKASKFSYIYDPF